MKNPNLETYEKIGAYLRLHKELDARIAVILDKELPLEYSGRFASSRRTIDKVCCDLDSKLFRDNSGLSSEYTKVFYGTITDGYINEVDREVIKNVIDILEDLLLEVGDAYSGKNKQR